MKITILTLFPQMFSALDESIIGRAQKAGKVEIEVLNIRDYATGKHLQCFSHFPNKYKQIPSGICLRQHYIQYFHK